MLRGYAKLKPKSLHIKARLAFEAAFIFDLIYRHDQRRSRHGD